CNYQDRQELEDDLYHVDEGGTPGSEENSELEFRLYSQLHYSANADEPEEQEDGEETEHGGQTQQLEVTFRFFEEVIVIDSSPEVILSEDDTADDDKGVCAVKGQSSYQLQTSTPAQQAKRKASLGGPVTVDSSSSESDSDSELESKSESASSDSSDSDDLENWMILGRGKQDGDHSISLNVEGGSDSNTGEWKHAAILCGPAHSEHLASMQHITKTKTGPPVKQQGEDNGRTPAYCYNCSRKGHFGHTCTSQRMFKGTYATTPFITHYDTMKDIKCRQHRIKLRVKELMKNGLMPEGSTAPLTQGPPKKKQKTSHPKNNHHLNPTPHQTSKNHKPSHIFFRNDNDFRASTPKTNKYHQPGIASTEKQWKPKRPVPTSREHLPPPKLLLDEADDFPRGGGENTEKRQRRRRRPKKWKQVPPEESKKAEKRKRRNHRKADKKLSAQIYPTDENLFIIKQRKRSR
ncbi:LOW QUALITY PROTEIN: zinc finger CCHC domain-containing protein 7, partial [Aulostomus maculatus]